MGFSSRGITSAEILAAIIDDATRFSGADIASILTDTTAIKDLKHGVIDVWGNPVSPYNVTGALTDITQSDVPIPNFANITLDHAYAMMYIAGFYDTSASSNGLNIASVIQADKAAAGWITAVDIPSNSIEISASQRFPAGVFFFGSDDIISRVALNTTTNFRWYQARCTNSNLVCTGVNMGVRLVF